MSWRYNSFEIVKDAAKNKPPTYRNCITGSPLTTLAEAYVLSLMAKQAAFTVPPCAYSYLWPDAGMAGRNFEHFLDGYEQRNLRVAELLAAAPDHMAVVADLKAFYPSVDRQRLRDKVAARLGQIQDTAASGPIRKFAEAFLSLPIPRTGLPIGPNLSHVLGHLALESVDRAMMEKYGERYLRYVDDVIVVCPKAEAGNALATLRQALDAEGLTLNEAKEDTVEPTTWTDECVSFSTQGDGESFESLLEAITVFLVFSPKSADVLHKRFRDEGFSLPIARLCSLARSERYQAHFMGQLSRFGGWWAWVKSWFATETSLIETARSIRSRLLKQAERLAEKETPTTPMRRRWYAQKRRYVLNRLLYLLPPQELPRLMQLTPDIDEFVESRVVLESLISGDATNILKYPGRVVSTLCQLWPEHHPATAPKVVWPKTGSRADAESATHLGLFLSLAPPEEELAQYRGYPAGLPHPDRPLRHGKTG